MKKITTPSLNRCESVELILRGAKKRRMMAYSIAASKFQCGSKNKSACSKVIYAMRVLKYK